MTQVTTCKEMPKMLETILVSYAVSRHIINNAVI